MIAWTRTVAQVVILVALFGAVATFSDWPRYRQLPPETAVVKLSFTHGSNREAECRRRTDEELAKLPPNMRKRLDCPRGRGALYVELDINGRSVYRASLAPSGISRDGPSRVYERFVVPAGRLSLAVRMRDTPRDEGFDHVKVGEFMLVADQSLVIDFRPESGGFVIR
jgi:hypothetical protein